MRIVLYTNILNPYRITFFDECNKYAKEKGITFKVVCFSKGEPNRKWKYDEFKRDYTEVLKSKTITLKYFGMLHFNNGIKSSYIKEKPDILILSGTYLQPSVLRLISLNASGVTLFWSESHLGENRNYDSVKLFIRDRIRKMIYGRMDGFWCPGTAAKCFVRKYSRRNARIIQVPNCVDNDFYLERNIISKIELVIKDIKANNKGARVMFTPARLEKEKGILEFCNVLRKIDNSRYVWVIAGDGTLSENVKACKSEGLNIVLLGEKNQEEIKSLYYLCDIVVMPSVADSNPLSVIEAMWCSKPLLLSENVGNYPETVVEGENGFVFSYDRFDEALNTVCGVLDKTDSWYTKAGNKSLDIAKRNFEKREIAKQAIDRTLGLIKE